MKKLLQQALDAFEHSTPLPLDSDDDYADGAWGKRRVVLAALRAAIAQPNESEPVAIRHSWDGHGWMYTDSGSGSGWRDSIDQPGAEFVYASPQVASDYVPMSDEQWQALQDETGEIWSSFTRNAIERAVRGGK